MNYPMLRDSPMISDENGWVKPLWAEGMQREGVVRAYTGLTLP
jgi:hypothetical protein